MPKNKKPNEKFKLKDFIDDAFESGSRCFRTYLADKKADKALQDKCAEEYNKYLDRMDFDKTGVVEIRRKKTGETETIIFAEFGPIIKTEYVSNQNFHKDSFATEKIENDEYSSKVTYEGFCLTETPIGNTPTYIKATEKRFEGRRFFDEENPIDPDMVTYDTVMLLETTGGFKVEHRIAYPTYKDGVFETIEASFDKNMPKEM